MKKSEGKISRVEVFVTTVIAGKVCRQKAIDGEVLRDHFQLSTSRPHKVKVAKGRHVLVPEKELSLMLYVKIKPKKS